MFNPTRFAVMQRAKVFGKQSALADQVLANVQRTMAAPPTITKKEASLAHQVDNLIIYTLPPSGTYDQTTSVLWYLALCALNKDSDNIREWCNLVSSMAYTLYSGALSAERARGVVIHVLTNDQRDAIVSFIDSLRGLSARPTQQEIDAVTDARTGLGGLILPTAQAISGHIVRTLTERAMWYGYFGVWVFAATKDIEDTGKAALQVSRFRAVKSKFKWTSDQAPMYEEGARPTDHAFKMMSRVWLRIPGIKRALFRYISSIPEHESSVEDDAMNTTTRLMKYSELTHMVLIHKFLNEYPWAADLPSLVSNVRTYNHGLTQLYEICDPIIDPRGRPVVGLDGTIKRDTSIMPYIKLIFGDSLDIAKRDGVKVLLYVAYETLRQTEETLSQYKVPEHYPVALNEFLAAKDALEEEPEETIMDRGLNDDNEEK